MCRLASDMLGAMRLRAALGRPGVLVRDHEAGHVRRWKAGASPDVRRRVERGLCGSTDMGVFCVASGWSAETAGKPRVRVLRNGPLNTLQCDSRVADEQGYAVR